MIEKPKQFKPNVTWLLGPQLMNGLRRILSYSFLRSRLDQRNWMTGQVIRDFAKPPADGELWWDYIADTGDGQLAMYDLASLVYSDLYEGESGKLALRPNGGGGVLPRGAFLVVGGDTAYHVADRATLAVQFKAPFDWAYQDLVAAGRLDDKAPPRALFGVPGNHDYYDEIDGFGRQFRRDTGDRVADDELRLQGFSRVQDATFFAIELPYDWWFWAVDLEIGFLDARQREFFRQIARPSPARLVVATPEPSTANGRLAERDDVVSTAFAQLDLELAYLGDPMRAGRCRLDLSGDTHNYQRYYGPDDRGGTARYASVVSGGGGAFLHPTNIDFGELPRKVVYPSPEVSRTEIGDGSMSPSRLVTSGLVAVIGGLVATILYLASIDNRFSKPIFDRLLRHGFRLDVERDVLAGPIGNAPLAPFWHGFAILGTILVAVVMMLLANRYALGRLPNQPNETVSTARYARSTIVVICALFLVGVTVAMIGDEPAATTLSNITASALGLAMIGGLVGLAVLMGADGQKPAGKVLFAVIGLAHGIFQVFLPLTLLRMLTPQAYGAAIAIGLVAWLLGVFLMSKKMPRAMLAVWLATGAAVLVVPRLWSGPSIYTPMAVNERVLCAGLAFATGWLVTAITLGWYFAVCLGFNGHGNEAASVARISDHKQFIRFKLGKDGVLTGHVIALDKLDPDLDRLAPVVIDMFSIAPE